MRAARPALLALALGSFAIATGEFMMIGLLPNVAASLHTSIPRTGYLISAYALGVVIGAPLLTAVSVWVNHKTFLIGAALAMAAGNFVSAVMPNFDSLLLVRFLSALPHGSYFGVASVVAGRMVAAERRPAAISVVFAGLGVANVAGVPLTTLVGQHAGWRPAFVAIGAVELVAVAAIAWIVPAKPDGEPSGERPKLRQELGTFTNLEVWLTLGVAMIGGGAMFASLSYIAPMMTHEAGYPSSAITLLLILFGAGMTAGTLIGARFAHRWPLGTIYVALAAEAAVAALFFFADRNQVTALFGLFAFPFCGMAILPAVQNRIVSLAGGAPNLASASIHAAFNIANSIGAWIGGAVIAAGLGYSAPNLAAAGIAVIGLAVALLSGRVAARQARPGGAGLPPVRNVAVPTTDRD